MKTRNNMKEKRILVIDDRHSDTQLLKRYVEDTHHYVVREENDPHTAVATAEEFDPHLILLDVLMPDIDGRELAASFQGNPRFKDVPIVFLTSVVTKEEVDLCGGQIGNYPFLAKPIVLKQVAAYVKHYLRE